MSNVEDFFFVCSEEAIMFGSCWIMLDRFGSLD